MNNKLRKEISKKVKELRLSRHWTQSRLARVLGLSQNRLSEIEGGQGSFTAEQFIQILKTFNVPIDYFSESQADEECSLQNILARLGATHLQEDPSVLPTERIKSVIDVIREVIASATSPRLITALAPVIVNHANPSILNKLRYQLHDLGLEHRLGWVLENILAAIKQEPRKPFKPLSHNIRFILSEGIISKFLASLERSIKLPKKNAEELWGLDAEIASEKTFEEVRKDLSPISKKWGIVSRLGPEDFAEALHHARNNH